MIRFVEIVIPRDDIYSVPYPPLSLACLTGEFRKNGYDLSIDHYHSYQDPYLWVTNLLSSKPKIICFSVFIGYKIEGALKLSRIIKQNAPHILILWGGVLPTVIPELILEDPAIDIVTLGPGENSIYQIFNAIKSNSLQSLSVIPSIGWKDNGVIRIQKAEKTTKSLPMVTVDWKSFNISDFIFHPAAGKNAIALLTSRGCPHSCSFCYNHSINGHRFQPNDINMVKEDLLYLRDSFGINCIFFHDDCFFGNKQRAKELINWMIDHQLTVGCVDLRIDEIDRETLTLLQKAGVISIFVGLESASDCTLKRINKGYVRKDIMKSFDVLFDYPDIMLWISCIVGFPNETFMEMQETISTVATFGYRRPSTFVNLNTYIPLPGTKMYADAISEGYKPPAGMEDLAQRGKQICASENNQLINISFNEEQMRYIKLSTSYLRMLNRSYRKSPINVIIGLFSTISYLRLKNGSVHLPFDIFLFELMHKAKSFFKKILR